MTLAVAVEEPDVGSVAKTILALSNLRSLRVKLLLLGGVQHIYSYADAVVEPLTLEAHTLEVYHVIVYYDIADVGTYVMDRFGDAPFTLDCVHVDPRV